MSHSDIDSEGFESADDDDFKEPATVKQATFNSKLKHSTNANNVAVESIAKEVETVDKFKALDIANDENSDNWGWSDDEDDANFHFSAPATDEQLSKVADLSLETAKAAKTESVVDNDVSKTAKVVAATSNENFSDSGISSSTVNSESTKSTAWTPWSGVVSLLSTASVGVASFTSHVSSAIESNIGMPNPEEFAQQQRQVKRTQSESINEKATVDDVDEQRQNDAENKDKLITLGSFVSNVTSIGNRVIAGGLDTLEGIGKKTMTILQENDAGLISKRKLLGLDNDKPVLSQVLREAKEKSEESEKSMKMAKKQMYKKQLHFETLFDDYHGLVHLEALEMLSKQAVIKLQSLLMPLTGIALSDLQQTMNSVSELCELSELDQDESPDVLYEVNELEEKFRAATEDFDIPIDFKDILNTWQENHEWLENSSAETVYEPQQIHDKALQCLAKTSALAVNKYHKLAELLLIKDHHSTVNEADCLIQLTNAFCWHLSGIATQFSGKLTNTPTPDPEIQTNNLITNIFLEGSKSTSYIQNAFQLFIPILQVGAV